MTKDVFCDIVVVAGGSGSRYPSELPKQFDLIHGRPLYLWSVDVFLNWKSRGAVVVVVPKDWVEAVTESFKIIGDPKLKVVAGGESRQVSAEKGVRALSSLSENTWVMIHDAARPLITEDLLERIWEGRRFDLSSPIGGVIPAVPANETIKKVSKGLKSAEVVETLERDSLCVVQTPQLLKRDLLLSAFQDQTFGASAFDDATLLEKAGFKIMVVDGDTNNIKVTYAEDKERVSHWLRNRHPSP